MSAIDDLGRSGVDADPLLVGARAGVCPLCTHPAGAVRRGPSLRALLRLSPRPARCTTVVNEEDWARAGGVGPVETCDCRDAFHGS